MRARELVVKQLYSCVCVGVCVCVGGEPETKRNRKRREMRTTEEG